MTMERRIAVKRQLFEARAFKTLQDLVGEDQVDAVLEELGDDVLAAAAHMASDERRKHFEYHLERLGKVERR